MDEIPIANNNPIVIKPKSVTPVKEKKRSPLLDTFINMILMFPLAMVVIYLTFKLGNTFGEYITFPLTSVISYIFIGSIFLILLVTQVMMRSIVYSTLVGISLVAGIFYAWFGNVYEPVVNNFSSVIDIMKSAWSRKDIPFELLISGSMTSIFLAVAFIQFIIALLTKSFFEMIFGKNWGDGKWMGYLGAIALIFGINISFNSYKNYSSENNEKLIWKNYQKYEPLEKFINKTPSSVTHNENNLWLNTGNELKCFDLKNGRLIKQKTIKSFINTNNVDFAYLPVIGTEDKFICYEPNINTVYYEFPYPKITASDSIQEKIQESDLNKPLVPLTVKYLNRGQYLLSIFDYGILGLYDLENGKKLWCKVIDNQGKISRMFPEKYLNDISFVEKDNNLIYSCNNGQIKSINMVNGNINWTYQHSTSKITGKPQKAYLSLFKDKVIANFKTGDIVSISVNDGHLIYKASNESYSSSTSVCYTEPKVKFLNEEGLYFEVNLENNKVISKINALPNKSDIYPILQNNENGIYIHRDKIYKISNFNNSIKTIYSCKNRTFVTNPVFEGKYLYIGTQDGWIFVIHYASESVKAIYHVDGELTNDSLKLFGDYLIVKTKSDSISVYNKNIIQ